MRVKFTQPFFAPGNKHKSRDGRVVSGQLYRPGIYDDVPDDLELPPSAQKLDDRKVESLPIPKRSSSLKDYDLDRAAGEAEDAAFDKAEVERKKRKPGRPKKYA